MAQKSSRTFSFVGHNIKKIRQAKNISQSDFAALFDLSRPSVGAYEEGRSEPKIETLIQISRYFNISVDVMLTRELSSKDIFSLGLLNKKLDRAHAADPKTQAVRSAPFISNKERIPYLVNRHDKTYLENLPKLGNPDPSSEIDLILEHEGQRLEVDSKGIRHGDLLLCRKRSSPTEASEKLWVLMTTDEILVGRVRTLENKVLTVSFDNPNYEDLQLKSEQIIECHLVAGVYSQHLSKPTSMENRLKAIEEKLKSI